MDDPAFDIVLASASPRRRQLLEDAGVRFRVRVSDVDETLEPDFLVNPYEAAKELAQRKARAVVEDLLNEGYAGSLLVIGADTMVVRGGRIFGKPCDEEDAARMLRLLSGAAHSVHTGVSVWFVDAPAGEEDLSLAFRTFVDTTRVTFRQLDEAAIAAYLETGEPFDKAGAYGIQGAGGALVEDVDGSLDTVIGLPVTRLLHDFPEIGVSTAERGCQGESAACPRSLQE